MYIPYCIVCSSVLFVHEEKTPKGELCVNEEFGRLSIADMQCLLVLQRGSTDSYLHATFTRTGIVLFGVKCTTIAFVLICIFPTSVSKAFMKEPNCQNSLQN